MQSPSLRFRLQQLFLSKSFSKVRIFLKRGIFYPNFYRFVWRRLAGDHPDGRHQHGGLKPTETSVTEFCYKSVNLSRDKYFF